MQNQNPQEKKPTVNFKIDIPTFEKRAFYILCLYILI